MRSKRKGDREFVPLEAMFPPASNKARRKRNKVVADDSIRESREIRAGEGLWVVETGRIDPNIPTCIDCKAIWVKTFSRAQDARRCFESKELGGGVEFVLLDVYRNGKRWTEDYRALNEGIVATLGRLFGTHAVRAEHQLSSRSEDSVRTSASAETASSGIESEELESEDDP
jgi:hypothetical protein